jgi:GntR family transcriptional repressor for pyruvate dehydrogenase complex
MRPLRVGNLIAKEMEALIKDGVWSPGDMLPSERELAQRFGVSRGSVREALRLLEATGLVTIRQGEGARVSDPSSSIGHLLAQRIDSPNIFHLFEFRLMLEPEVAALAAQRANSEHLQALKEVTLYQRRAIDDPHKFLFLDMQFHRLIAEASGNPILLEIISALNVGFRETRLRAMARVYDPLASLVAHERILEAIMSRDATRARETMREHLKRVEVSALGAEALKGEW